MTEASDPALSTGEAPSESPLDADELKRRARVGELLLGLRTVVMQLTVLGGGIVLARLLDPINFGVFVVVQFFLGFFAFFGDAGLGAALIQRKQVPGQRELSSVFWLQLSLSAAVVVVVVLGSSKLNQIWAATRGLLAPATSLVAPSDLPASAGWLLRVLALALCFTVVRVIPQILMERELQFGRLAAVDIVNSVGFYLVAIPMAVAGLGTWSLVGGVLGQSALATATAYLLRPWRPRWMFDRAALRPILRFGIPFQAKNLIGFANGAVAPVYAGGVLGAGRLGYINWAQSTAYFPLKLVEVMTRVTFPLFSRFQHDPALLSRSLGRAVQICAMGTLFYVGLVFGIGRPLIAVVYTAKWLPALPLLYIYAGAISIGFLAPLVASALDAMGRPEVFLKLSIGWTILAWLVVPFTTPRWGMVGFVAGYVVHVVVGNLAVIVVLRKLIPQARLWRPLRASLVGAILVALAGRYWWTAHIHGVLTLVVAVAVLVALFLAVVVALDYRRLRDALSLLHKPAPSEAPHELAPAPDSERA